MAGRPRKELDQSQFEKLCGLQCTQEEIAGFFDVSTDTVDRWCKRTYDANFAEVYKNHSGRGKIALRRYQMHLAETNASMAIFLGKQYLGQKDIQNSDDKLQKDEMPKVEFVITDTSYKEEK